MKNKILIFKNLKRRNQGFTLIELLIVIVIIGLIMGVFVVSFKVLPKLKTQQSSRQLASLIKFVSSTSKTLHRPCRLVFDLDTESPSLKIQILPPNNILTSLDPVVKSKEDDEDDDFVDWEYFDPNNPIGNLGTEDNGKPFRPAFPDWQELKVKRKDKLKLASVRITKISFPCMDREFYKGQIGIIFFPDGSNPGAVISLEGKTQNTSFVIVEPGLSKVKIRTEESDFENICYDALGNLKEEEEEND